MAKQTSKAEHFSARLNPRSSEAERRALEIITSLTGQGYNFKEIVVDAIIRAGGIDPATLPSAGLTADKLETVLAQFADKIIGELKAAGVKTPNDSEFEIDETEESSPFARNFAASFSNRKKGTGA